MQRRREQVALSAVGSVNQEYALSNLSSLRSTTVNSIHSSVTERENNVTHLQGGGHEDTDSADAATLNSDLQAYPPADRGRGAWLMLAGCFIVQLPIWGFSLAFGIFQEYYTSQDPTISGGKGSIPVIGAAHNGVLYLLSPVAFAILTKFPKFRPYCGVVGVILAIVGFVASSFVNQVWQLIITQGVVAPIGCGLLFSPTTLYLNEWFVERKGLAIGIMWSAKSIVGVVIPFAAQGSLEKFGSQNTLRAWTVVVLLTTLPVLKFIRPRIPVERRSSSLLEVNFFRMPSFWVFQCNNIMQGLGYFVPSQYLYSYSTSVLGFPTFVGTLMTSAINASSTVGGIVLGWLCDRYPVANVMLVSSVGSALAVLVFWGLSSPAGSASSTDAASYACLALFTIVYGFFAGGFSSTWSGVLKHLKQEAPALESGLMFGLLAGGRGVGNVISGPVSAALLEKGSLLASSNVAPTRSGWLPGYGTQYGGVILFTGLTALACASSWFWRRPRVSLV